MTLATIKRMELHCVRERVAPYARTISASRDVARLLTDLIGKYDSERLIVLMLDARNVCIGYTQAAQGGLAACHATPADVFRVPVHTGAVGIIVAHNHPSEDPKPSDADIVFTKRLREAGELLGVQVLDHLVVTSDPTRYASLADMGMML